MILDELCPAEDSRTYVNCVRLGTAECTRIVLLTVASRACYANMILRRSS